MTKTATAPKNSPVTAPEPVRRFAVTVPASRLRAALTKVAGARGDNYRMMPIVLGVRLAVDDGALTVTCTDTDIWATTVVGDAKCTDGPAVTVVNLRLLRQILVGMSGVIGLAGGGDGLTGGGDGDLTVNDQRGTITVRAMPAGDWPKTPDVNGPSFRLDPAHLAAILPAAANDEARPILCGVAFGDGFMVATDRYRLHYIDGGAPHYPNVIVPARALHAAARSTRPATLTVGETRVAVVSDGQTWTARVIAGKFAIWRALTKMAAPYTLTVDRAALTAALAHVARIPGDPYHHPARLNITADKLSLTRIVTDVGTAEATIDAEWAGLNNLTVAFNCRYLAAAINAGHGDTVTFDITDGLKPGFVTDDSPVRRLLMPVRLA